MQLGGSRLLGFEMLLSCAVVRCRAMLVYMCSLGYGGERTARSDVLGDDNLERDLLKGFDRDDDGVALYLHI